MLSPKNQICISLLRQKFECVVSNARRYTKKEERPSEPAKKEEMKVKMPGFIHPENLKEEGYFTQKPRQQLEEMKRKAESTTVESSDKKI